MQARRLHGITDLFVGSQPGGTLFTQASSPTYRALREGAVDLKWRLGFLAELDPTATNRDQRRQAFHRWRILCIGRGDIVLDARLVSRMCERCQGRWWEEAYAS